MAGGNGAAGSQHGESISKSLPEGLPAGGVQRVDEVFAEAGVCSGRGLLGRRDLAGSGKDLKGQRPSQL